MLGPGLLLKAMVKSTVTLVHDAAYLPASWQTRMGALIKSRWPFCPAEDGTSATPAATGP